MTRGHGGADESMVQVIDLGARLGREEEGRDRDCCTRKKKFKSEAMIF